MALSARDVCLLMKIFRLLKLWPKAGEVYGMTQYKGWAESKTVWANMITVGAAAVFAITEIDLGVTDETASSIAVAVVAIYNIWLRFKTEQPISLQPRTKTDS
jgi:hypothetical protein